jgi:ribonuclease T2
MLAGAAAAQHARQNEPGKFDFYVLALSWSPSFCEQAGERKSAQQQCGARPFSFVVHGLWPQYEKGFPEFCKQPAPRLDRNIVSSMLDLMPAPRLIFNEWDKHGVCSGLPARGYFETVRKARALVKIPPEFLEPKSEISVSPDEIEEAFVKANPELTRIGIAVTCGSTQLNEVRICLSRDLKFRECPDVDRRACRREKLRMPPVRGG